jgi:hypothetical protein
MWWIVAHVHQNRLQRSDGACHRWPGWAPGASAGDEGGQLRRLLLLSRTQDAQRAAFPAARIAAAGGWLPLSLAETAHPFSVMPQAFVL